MKWIQMKGNTFYIGHISLTLNYDWNYSKHDASEGIFWVINT